MERFAELLEKRKKLTATIYEEEELIGLSKKLSKEELDEIDPNLLTYSNDERFKNIMSLFDRLDALIKMEEKS